MTYTVSCDMPGCGERFRYRHSGEKESESWLEIYTEEDESLDFCSRECLVMYFDPNKEDEE